MKYAKYTKDVYIGYDPFDGDRDVDIRCKKVKIVKIRKTQKCIFEKPHDMQPGTMARFESALVDGKWGSYYMCLDCLDNWLSDVIGLEANKGK